MSSTVVDTGRLFELLAARLAPRLAFSPDEAAATLGVSRDWFDEHVKPELRVTRRGQKVLVPVRELERWLEESAALTLAADL